jgi:hypothetical protein
MQKAAPGAAAVVFACQGAKVVPQLLYFQSQRQPGDKHGIQKAATEALSRYGATTRGKRLTTVPRLCWLLRNISRRPAAEVPASCRPVGPFSVPHGQTYGQGPGAQTPAFRQVIPMGEHGLEVRDARFGAVLVAARMAAPYLQARDLVSIQPFCGAGR